MNKNDIKEIAKKMVRRSGMINLSREGLCQEANIPNGSFAHVVGCNFIEFMEELKQELPDQDPVLAVSKKRVPAAMRREQILQVAVELSKQTGYNKLTREQIAERAGISVSLITNHFHTMNQLRRDIIRYSIKNNEVAVIAQGLAAGDKRALKAPSELKAKAAKHIASL